MLISAAALIVSMVWAGYGLSDITLFILCFTAGLLIYNYYFLISMVVEKQAKRNGMKEPPECAVYFWQQYPHERRKGRDCGEISADREIL